jgi:beta-N-acetylhexosaminidase
MTAHISLPCIDLTRPATLSPDVMGILRKDMAYDATLQLVPRFGDYW